MHTGVCMVQPFFVVYFAFVHVLWGLHILSGLSQGSPPPPPPPPPPPLQISNPDPPKWRTVTHYSTELDTANAGR